MFITAVCVLFFIKLRWPKNKSIYETISQFPFVFLSKRVQCETFLMVISSNFNMNDIRTQTCLETEAELNPEMVYLQDLLLLIQLSLQKQNQKICYQVFCVVSHKRADYNCSGWSISFVFVIRWHFQQPGADEQEHARHFDRLIYFQYTLSFVKERPFRSVHVMMSWHSYGNLTPGNKSVYENAATGIK